jgi:ubiquinone/menaquinone biosynthesis C-methylase UbiE
MGMNDDHVKKTIDVYNKIARDYSVSMEEYTPELERKKFVMLVKKGGKILDVGSAAGRDCIYFNKHGLLVTGVDLSDELLKIARNKAPQIEFIKKDIRNLNFSSDYFDGIWSCAVLLHLKRPEVKTVLAQYYKMLKNQGILMVMVKKGEGEKDIAEKLSSNETRHFTLFQPEEIENMIVSAGFQIMELFTWNSQDRWPKGRSVDWISCFARKE